MIAAANYKRRAKEGGLHDDPHFNEVTVFDAQTRSFIREHCAKGDLVHVEGHVRQNSYERDGQTYFTVDLIALNFGLLAKSSVLGKAGAPEDDGAAKAPSPAHWACPRGWPRPLSCVQPAIERRAASVRAAPPTPRSRGRAAWDGASSTEIIVTQEGYDTLWP